MVLGKLIITRVTIIYHPNKDTFESERNTIKNYAGTEGITQKGAKRPRYMVTLIKTT